jgi:hypothetical protein
METRLIAHLSREKVLPFAGLDDELEIGLDGLLITARPSPSIPTTV